MNKDDAQMPSDTKYVCSLGSHYFIKSPFPIYVMGGGECVAVIDSDGDEGRDILIKGDDITYLGITDKNGMDVKNIGILEVLNSLKELFDGEPNYEHLIEPIEWHIDRFKP